MLQVMSLGLAYQNAICQSNVVKFFDKSSNLNKLLVNFFQRKEIVRSSSAICQLTASRIRD